MRVGGSHSDYKLCLKSGLPYDSQVDILFPLGAAAGDGSPNKGAKQSPRSAAGGTRRTKYLKPDSPALELHEVLFVPYLPLLSDQFGGPVDLVSPIW